MHCYHLSVSKEQHPIRSFLVNHKLLICFVGHSIRTVQTALGDLSKRWKGFDYGHILKNCVVFQAFLSFLPLRRLFRIPGLSRGGPNLQNLVPK